MVSNAKPGGRGTRMAEAREYLRRVNSSETAELLRVALLRVWMTLGWWSVILGLYLAMCGSLPIITLFDGRPELGVAGVEFFVIAIPLGLYVTVSGTRRYPRSTRTASAEAELARLTASRERYCLVLRPFGHDGYASMSRGWRPWLLPPALGLSSTLEQIVASSARRAARLSTYSIVDQARLVAPPGPKYLQVDNTNWKTVAAGLIAGAHTIVIVLPPGAELRASLAWELAQITARGAQSRVVLVLPPHKPKLDSYRVARYQASVLVSVFRGFARSLDEVSALDAMHWELALSQQEHVLIVRPTVPVGRDVELHWWYSLRRRVTAKTYRKGFEKFFREIAAEHDKASSSA